MILHRFTFRLCAISALLSTNLLFLLYYLGVRRVLADFVVVRLFYEHVMKVIALELTGVTTGFRLLKWQAFCPHPPLWTASFDWTNAALQDISELQRPFLMVLWVLVRRTTIRPTRPSCGSRTATGLSAGICTKLFATCAKWFAIFSGAERHGSTSAVSTR